MRKCDCGLFIGCDINDAFPCCTKFRELTQTLSVIAKGCT